MFTEAIVNISKGKKIDELASKPITTLTRALLLLILTLRLQSDWLIATQGRRTSVERVTSGFAGSGYDVMTWHNNNNNYCEPVFKLTFNCGSGLWIAVTIKYINVDNGETV